MEELIDFLKRLLTSIGLKYTEDGYVQIESDGVDTPVLLSNKSLVLPTNENIKSLVGRGESGETEVLKTPFNPIHEDSVKGDTKCFQQLKIIMEKRISHTIAGLGELLLTMASDKSLQANNTLAINKFLSSINEAKTPHNSTGRNKLIDEKTVENWLKLYESYVSKPVGLVSINVKKSAKINGVKYNRVATLISDLYDVLLDSSSENSINGVKLRNKDIAVFKLLIEFLLDGIKEEQNIYIASMDKEHPAFISLTKLYIKVMGRLMPMVKVLKNINPITGDSAYLDILVNDEELDNLEIYKPFLLTIPEEFDLIGNTNKKSSKLANINISYINNSPSLTHTGMSSNPILNDALNQQVTSPNSDNHQVDVTTQKLQNIEKEIELKKKMLELEKYDAEIANLKNRIPNSMHYLRNDRPHSNREVDDNDPVIAAGRSIGSPMSGMGYRYAGTLHTPGGSINYDGYGRSTYNKYAYPVTRYRR